MASPVCAWCKRAVTGPKIVHKGMWCCQTCMYYLDKGETPPASKGR